MSRKRTGESAGVAESPGIGLYAESALHAGIKELFRAPGDRVEVRMHGRCVDLLRANGEILEIQTGNFGRIRDKVRRLAAAGERVTVVHPVIGEKRILRLDPDDGHVLSSRRSPRRGTLLDLFDELVHFPDLLLLPGCRLLVLLLDAEELRTADGRGSWRRKFQSITDRRAGVVRDARLYAAPADLLSLLPAALPAHFTARVLAELLGCPAERARQLLYCLRALGLAETRGKEGRAFRWELVRKAMP